MKRYLLLGSISALLLISSLLVNHQALAADPTLTATTTVANVSEVKASRTIGVAALPANAETFTIGSCVVTFTTVASSTTDELNCNDNAASIDRTVTASDTPRTVTQIATQIQTLTNASSSGTHGALTVASGGTATTTSFTTTNTETSATPITFTDGTGGDIVNISSTTGVVPVAEVVTFTPAGVTAGSQFKVTIYGANASVSGSIYTYTAKDNTVKDVVEGLNALMVNDPDVGCTENDAVLTCTSDTAGIGFTYDTAVIIPSSGGGGGGGHHGGGGGSGGGTTTPPPTTPPGGCQPGDLFSRTNGQPCGTVTNPLIPVGCQAGYSYSPVTGEHCPVITPVITPGPGAGAFFTRDLTIGATGDDVRALQIYLNTHGSLLASTGPGSPGNETNLFGPLTKAALAKFQAAHNITPSVGYFGPITRAYVIANP